MPFSIDTTGNPFLFIGQIFFTIIFIVISGIIIFRAFKGISTWNHNNAQPKLNVSAMVVSKRQNISTNVHNNSDNFTQSYNSTTYYVTFEVVSGSRMEFKMSGSEYGLLIEQDKGELSFQGTRYLGFNRTIG